MKYCIGFRRVLFTLGDVQPFWEGICVCALMFSLALGDNRVRRLKIIKKPKTSKTCFFNKGAYFGYAMNTEP